MNTETPTPPAVVLSTALLDAFDAYTRNLVVYPHPMTPEMWQKGWPFFEAGWNAAILAEREACAKVCEAHARGWENNPGNDPMAGFIASSNCATDIKARSNAEVRGA